METINEQICPLCGGDNHCKAKTAEPFTCWCMATTVPNEILEAVPDESKGKQCICQNCMDTYLKQ